MKYKNRLNLSQSRHRSLFEQTRYAVIFDGDYDTKVKNIYHSNVYKSQNAKKRMLTSSEKKRCLEYAKRRAKEL